jgi:hypothetical protein
MELTLIGGGELSSGGGGATSAVRINTMATIKTTTPPTPMNTRLMPSPLR